MNQSFSMSASRLMADCTNNLSRQIQKCTITNKTNQINLDKENQQNIKTISPQQEDQNNRIIQRLKKKAKRKAKQIFIRKTDLGQGQFVFTPQELQKLSLIDQFEAMGLTYQDIPKEQELNAQKIKKLSQPENPIDQIKRYMQWIDVSELNKIKRQTRHKQLNFQKRSIHKLDNALENKGNQKKLANKNQSQMKKVSSLKITIPLLHKVSTQNKFLDSYTINSSKIPRSKTKKQILNQVFDKANKKVKEQCKAKNHIFMTEQRKQALFQCQLLRNLKHSLGQKAYNKIHFFHSQKENMEIRQRQTWQRQKEQRDSFNYQKTQAQKILQKNNQRIKNQRKRIIQKLIC